ncbi:MAG: GTP-binding protein [Candidatus Norongarragalinales archaeon]
MKISLLGHKDHGKSTLIGRLLVDCGVAQRERVEHVKRLSESLGKDFEYAFLLDAFREERLEGLTIDATSAKIAVRGTVFELIDVPGHKELVKNMLSGASRADYALLVVSAKPGEGFQEETMLHVFLARLLGLEKIIVAVTKMDLSGYSRSVFDELAAKVLDYLNFVGFEREQVRILPVSAMDGVNLKDKSDKTPWFDGAPLLEEIPAFFGKENAEQAEARALAKPARFIVQDEVDVGGEPVFVGRVEQGSLRKGERVVFIPQGATGSIKEFVAFGDAKTEEVKAGENTGLRILFDSAASQKPARGSVACKPDSVVRAVKRFTAKFFVLPGFSVSLLKPVKLKNAAGEFECSTEEVVDKIDFFNRTYVPTPGVNEARSTECFRAVFSSERPAVVESFKETPFLGRFVLLDDKKQIAAVGVVEKTFGETNS